MVLCGRVPPAQARRAVVWVITAKTWPIGTHLPVSSMATGTASWPRWRPSLSNGRFGAEVASSCGYPQHNWCFARLIILITIGNYRIKNRSGAVGYWWGI